MAIEDIIREDIDCVYAAKLMAPYLELAVPLLPKPSKAERAKWAVGSMLWGCLEGVAAVTCVVGDSLYLLTHPKYLKEEIEERKHWKKEREERKRMGLKSEDEEMVQSLIDARDEDKRQLEHKLTTAGVVMPQGRQAWIIAHCAGLCIKRNSFTENYPYGSVTLRAAWTRCDDGYYRPKILDEKGINPTDDISTVRPIEVCYSKNDFERILDIAIRDGVRCLGGYIINQDFNEKARGSLLQEIYSRLDTEKKFKLLDAVSIRQEQDRIYLNDLVSLG